MNDTVIVIVSFAAGVVISELLTLWREKRSK